MEAVRQELIGRPDADLEALHLALRRRGGAFVKVRFVDVQEACDYIVADRRRDKSLLVPVDRPTFRDVQPDRDFSRAQSSFRRAVFDLVAAEPTRGVAEYDRKLQEQGWREFDRQDLMAAWRLARAALPSPRRDHRVQSLSIDPAAWERASARRSPRYSVQPAKGRTWSKGMLDLGVCPSCGVAFLPSGACRCFS